MNQIAVYILIFLGGILGCYLYLKPKIKAVKEIDEFTQKENEKLWKQRDKLQQEIKANQEAIEENKKTAEFWTDYLAKAQRNANHTAESYKQKCMESAEKDIEEKLQALLDQYDKAESEYRKEYQEIMEDCTAELEKDIQQKLQEKAVLIEEINQQKSTIAAIVEDNKRRAEEINKIDFYRLNLSEQDKQEILKLREIVPYLRNPEPLNKVIWKVYYEKPYTDLIGRVVGTGVHTGIYKITNIENQMCYVGQAANIADRWKTHIKRGIGAEPLINNKLYPAMLTYGVENFTFEVIEECHRANLNEREDYWQEFFKAKEFGYSIK